MGSLITKARDVEKLRDTQNYSRLARIDAGLEECLFMGNLDAKRDWGHARDYVECNGECCSRRQRISLSQQAARKAFEISSGSLHEH